MKVLLSPSELARLATILGGLPILGCLAGSPADGAGIRYGDILLRVNGMPTASWDDFLQARDRDGTRLAARVFRQGVELELSFELRPSTKSPLEVLDELQSRRILPSDNGHSPAS
jgi:S1-C subfamily serine protease